MIPSKFSPACLLNYHTESSFCVLNRKASSSGSVINHSRSARNSVDFLFGLCGCVGWVQAPGLNRQSNMDSARSMRSNAHKHMLALWWRWAAANERPPWRVAGQVGVYCDWWAQGKGLEDVWIRLIVCSPDPSCVFQPWQLHQRWALWIKSTRVMNFNMPTGPGKASAWLTELKDCFHQLSHNHSIYTSCHWLANI